jgi:hypothetical protein
VREIIRLQQLPDSLANALLPYLSNSFDDLHGLFPVAVRSFQTRGCAVDESLVFIRPRRIGRQAFDRGDRQHELGNRILVDLCKAQHSNGPSNRRRTASERIVLSQTLLKRAGEMAGVRQNLWVRPSANEYVVPIIRQDYDAVHVRRQPFIGINTSEDLRIEPRHRTVFAGVASVHPHPVAQPSQVRCSSQLLPELPCLSLRLETPAAHDQPRGLR